MAKRSKDRALTKAKQHASFRDWLDNTLFTSDLGRAKHASHTATHPVRRERPKVSTSKYNPDGFRKS